MEQTTVTDLYEAVWLLMNGCTLDEVECFKLSGKLACRLSFSGNAIPLLQDEYFVKKASVNLFSFRQGYNQINGLVHQAKKNFSQREKELNRQAAEQLAGSEGAQ